MKLIIEGPDLAGKTTVIETVAKFYNKGFTLKNNYKPKTRKDSKLIYEQYWMIINLIKDQDFVILDRFYPSQAVYSYMRGQNELESPQIRLLDRECRKDYLYIYIDTPLEELKERYLKRGDEHVSIENLDLLKTRYDRFYELTSLKKLKLDTSDCSWLEEIKNFVREAENEYK